MYLFVFSIRLFTKVNKNTLYSITNHFPRGLVQLFTVSAFIVRNVGT